jgi:glycosyltransferase involved in cell wall biosynthesis
MLTVIIPTFNCERTLVPTLAMLVQGAMSGLVREVVVADGGSSDATIAIADNAGCTLAPPAGAAAALGARLKTAAAAARTSWLLFLRPGTVLEVTWLDEVALFIDEAERSTARTAAVFTKQASLREPYPGVVLSLIAFVLSRRAHPDQGLLIGRALYDEVGGHSATAADPEAQLLARLGRRRIVVLRSGARR